MTSPATALLLESMGLNDSKDCTLPLIEHLIETVAALKESVAKQDSSENTRMSTASKTFGLFISKMMTNALGRAVSNIVTKDFAVINNSAGEGVAEAKAEDAGLNSSKEAITGYQKISQKILTTFPEFVSMKGGVGEKMLMHHAAFRHSATISDAHPNDKVECMTSKSFEILLQAHPDAAKQLDGMGATALHWATRNKNMTKSGLMTLIRANDRAPMTKDKSGYLPLHWAVCQDTPSPIVVQALINCYPEALMMFCDEGTLPIHWCVNRNKPNIDVVRMLLTGNGNTASELDSNGCTPLHRCVNRNDPDLGVTQLLVEAYPEALEVQDKEGHIPLHLAIDHDTPSSDVVKFLLSANPSSAGMKDMHGHLPLHCILDNPRPDYLLAELFLDAFPDAAKMLTDEGMYPIHILTSVCEDPSPHFTSELLNLYPSAVRHEVIDSIPAEDGANIHTWKGEWKEIRWSPFGRASERNLFKIVPILRAARFKAICKSNADGSEAGIRKTIGGPREGGSSLSPNRPQSPSASPDASLFKPVLSIKVKPAATALKPP